MFLCFFYFLLHIFYLKRNTEGGILENECKKQNTIAFYNGLYLFDVLLTKDLFEAERQHYEL